MKRLIILLFSINCLAQQQAANWYFGSNAGIKFDAAGNVTVVTNGQLNTLEGCAALSDTNGNLQMYTDGITVFNKLHQIMSNGTGLMGDPSTTQSATIVPKPGSSNLFYVFTLDAFAGVNGFRYSVVNIAANGGLGEVTAEKNVLLYTPSNEKIAVVKHSNGVDYWIVTHGWDSNAFYSHLLTSAGVSATPVVSNVGVVVTGDTYANLGHMKFSPSGNKIAICNSFINSELLDFNKITGIVSNSLVLRSRTMPIVGYDYGVEFAPDGSKLYLSTLSIYPEPAYLFQFDLNATNIPNSAVLLASGPTTAIKVGALQIAPNGKIYMASRGNPNLSVINQPDNLGTACGFVYNAISLNGRICQIGLPSFVSSFFYNPSIIASNACQNQSTQLQVGNVALGSGVSWTFGDGTVGSGNPVLHTYATAGDFTVSATVTNSSGTASNGQQITVFAEPNLITNSISLKQCDDNTDGFSVFNLNEVKPALVSSQTGLVFSFHKTLTNAQNNLLPIANPSQYINTVVSNDVVFVRVQNPNGCFKTAQINLHVSTTQIPTSFSRILTACDNAASGSNSDGIATFNFSSVKQDFINLFPVGQLLDISFYKNLADAFSESNAINNITNYNNIGNPNTQNIWIRVDSQTNNDCLGLGQYLKLVVDRIPVVQPLTLTECDDNQDGSVGFDTTNLESSLLNGLSNVAVSYTDQNNNAVTMTNPFVTNNKVLNVKVKNNFGQQCEFNSSVTFVVSTLPQFFALPASLTTACDDEANPENQDGKVAFDTTAFLPTILGNQRNMIVSYFDLNNNPITLTNPFLTGTQNIKVQVVNAMNTACAATGTINFVVHPVPKMTLSGNELVCSNNPNFTKVIDAGSVDVSTINNFSYEWSKNEVIIPNQSSYTLMVNAEGTYRVKVRNSVGCSRTRTIAVAASEIAKIDNIIVTDLTDLNVVTIKAIGQGVYEYSLDDVFYQDSNVFQNISSGIYTVYVRDKKECGTAKEEISILGIPKFFSPNGDSFNDFWSIKGINQKFNGKSNVNIFDRFGKMIFQVNPLSQGWDGTFNGQLLPADDYWYVVSLQDGRTVKGHFSLKR